MKTKILSAILVACGCCLLVPAPLPAAINVTAKIKVPLKGSAFDKSATTTNTYFLKNSSPAAFTGPFKVVIESLNNRDVVLVNPDGYTREGKPYYEYPDLSLKGYGTSVANKDWKFQHRCGVRVSAAVKPFNSSWQFASQGACSPLVTVYVSVFSSEGGINSTPVADAGPDQTVKAKKVVALDGSPSTDENGDPLSYKWSVVSKPVGSRVTLTGATSVTPTVKFTLGGTYVLGLTVTDRLLTSARDTCTLSTTNSRPVADAGSDQTVNAGTTVWLDGSRSTDADGNRLTYAWSIVSMPAGSTAALSSASAVRPSFRTDLAGEYVLQLVASQGTKKSFPDFCRISSTDTRPRASAGADQKFDQVPGAVHLDGVGSTDVDGDPLSYSWALLAKPAGSGASLSNAASVRSSFTADVAGTYVAQLIVNDGHGDSVPDTVIVTTENVRPMADAGPDQTVDVGPVSGLVTLNGGGSADADDNPLTWKWAFLSVPKGSLASLVGATTAQPTFTADVPGAYVVQLVVSDGLLNSYPDTVVIDTGNSRPRANAGVDRVADTNSTVYLDGSGSSDPDGAITTPRWAMLVRPPGSAAVLNDPTIMAPSFIPDLPGTYVVQLIVDDGTFASEPDTVAITVTAGLVSVPNVTGMTQTAAEATIVAAHLTVGGVTWEYDGAVPVGSVISQDPLAGASVTAGSAVALVVSLGPQLVTVPNVVGMGQATAETAIRVALLTVGNVTSAYDATVPADKVISQDPAAGASVAAGSAVALVVSLGQQLFPVPDLAGLTRTAAESAIIAAGLAVGAVTQEFSETIAAGTVMGQSPSAGALKPAGSAVRFVLSLGPIVVPPDPAGAAPPLDRTVATTLFEASEFLYSGGNPVQLGVAPGTIEMKRAAVLRGKVLAGDGSPLSGVVIAVLDHPEYGVTASRNDGMFDLAVNGGLYLTLRYRKSGYFEAQRQLSVPWQDFVLAPDVVLIVADAQVTTIDTASTAPFQVARGSQVTDVSGTRQATLLFPQGTGATMLLPDGSTQPLATLHVRATEYTVGPNGPAAMPAPLPPTSGYTYAVELSADEAVAAGATAVNFSQPVYAYLENFLHFPAGMVVPSGYYDRVAARWIEAPNGRVIQILSISAGLADLDTNGDGLADDATVLAALGVTDAERQQLASTYAAGATLWRVPIAHFSPWDFNWPFGPPPNAGPPRQPPPKLNSLAEESCEQSGSIIECQSQVLGEKVGIVGTPFSLSYRSSRTAGNRWARVTIPLSGTSLPASLARIDLEIEIGGKRFTESHSPSANLYSTFDWDGVDAYGRSMQGSQKATIKIGYVYPGVYLKPSIPANYDVSFGHTTYYGTPATGDPYRREVTLWQTASLDLSQITAGAWDARGAGLGGWMLDAQRFYDVNGHVLYLGGGGQQTPGGLGNGIITTVAGAGYDGLAEDGVPATQARISGVAVAVGLDGSIYLADNTGGGSRVRRVGPDGIITTVTGSGTRGFSGDGGPALQAQLNGAGALAVTIDGSIYVVDVSNRRVRRVGPDGIITTVAGGGAPTAPADGIPATQANISPTGVAVAPDGSVYIAHQYGRILRVGPDGIMTTVAGDGTTQSLYGYASEGHPALQEYIGRPGGVALGPDGTVYFSDTYDNRVYRVSPDGLIYTVAGSFGSGFSGDGGAATLAKLQGPAGVAVGPDGALYIADDFNRRVRRVGTDGIINTVAGVMPVPSLGDGGPATQAYVQPRAIAWGPDDNMYIADNANWRIRRVGPPLPGLGFGEITVAAEDGGEIYVFDGSGRQLRTLDALTGAVRYQFGYDAEGRLGTVTDGYDNVTTIERNTGGEPVAIVGPYGQRTTLAVDANGYLSTITNPAGETIALTSSTGGLLETLTDPLGNVHRFTYDTLGRLIRDENPSGSAKTLARTETANGFTVSVSTALGRTTAYRTESLSTGGYRRTLTDSAGGVTQATIDTNASAAITFSDATAVNVVEGPDPRWGMQAPVLKSATVKRPGGTQTTIAGTYTATLDTSVDPNLNLVDLTGTTTVNGRVYTDAYDADLRQITATSPMGRQITVAVNPHGRPLQTQVAGLVPTTYDYDARGRIASITGGSGTDARVSTFAYGGAGYVSAVTGPLGDVVSFANDTAGRRTQAILPGGQVIGFGHDANGRLTQIVPSGRPAHTFSYTAGGLLSAYSPPDVGAGTTPTSYAHDLDGRLVSLTRPDGRTLGLAYDTAGRRSTLTLPRGALTYTYSGSRFEPATVTAPGGITLTYTYDGALQTGTTWGGPLAGKVERTFDANFRMTSVTVNGVNPISFLYDNDSLLTKAGDLTITRSADNDLVSGTALGSVTDASTYNGFGELDAYSAAFGAASIYSAQFTRDKLGRIVTRTETIDGATVTSGYAYDLSGRLVQVTRDGTTAAAYTYDGNGNRLSATGPGGTVNATYDAQDRLLQYGDTAYIYAGGGELLTQTTGTATTTYDYDEIGNLMSVTLPAGKQISYLIDGSYRRIGKKVDGVLAKGFLYDGLLRLVAELDGTGAVVSRFVYASADGAPRYMIKGGQTYRLITDHLGSPRLVVNVTTGSIEQRLDYDEFGVVIADTNPGYQPFGFAGGLYDPDTGLVRFGARDYDARAGRWTAKDWVLHPNLYEYAGDDPVNRIDRRGLESSGYHDEELQKALDRAVDEYNETHPRDRRWLPNKEELLEGLESLKDKALDKAKDKLCLWGIVCINPDKAEIRFEKGGAECAVGLNTTEEITESNKNDPMLYFRWEVGPLEGKTEFFSPNESFGAVNHQREKIEPQGVAMR